jgi:hypothetical protein
MTDVGVDSRGKREGRNARQPVVNGQSVYIVYGEHIVDLEF